MRERFLLAQVSSSRCTQQNDADDKKKDLVSQNQDPNAVSEVCKSGKKIQTGFAPIIVIVKSCQRY